jgi:hypothetical protein
MLPLSKQHRQIANRNNVKLEREEKGRREGKREGKKLLKTVSLQIMWGKGRLGAGRGGMPTV